MYAVTLDLWRTLIDEGPGDSTGRPRQAARVSGILDVMRSVGMDLDRKTVEQSMARMRESFDRDHDAGVDVRFEQRVSELAGFIRPDLPESLPSGAFARLVDAVDAPFLTFPPLPVPGAGDVLRRLRTLGARLALISNTGFTSANTYRKWMKTLGWLDLFDVTTFSNEAAVAKPTPEVFRMTVKAMNIWPSNALHVGDSLAHDVAGAQRAGLRAVWIQRSAHSSTDVVPDFVVASLSELPATAETWLRSIRAR
ncbi:MAG: HAD family hydrolase [Chloroflexi bacterium]|nr:HAD family hydrolase [Chloroflexota bacterium]